MKNLILFLFFVLFLGGCIKEVKPWEKSIHAKATMQDGGLNALEKIFEEHIYFSKEGTKNGNGISGGGCGCN